MDYIRLACLPLMLERDKITPVHVLFYIKELDVIQSDLFAIEHDVWDLGLAHMVLVTPPVQVGLIRQR